MIEVQTQWIDEDKEKSTHSVGVLNSVNPAGVLELVEAMQSISAASLIRYGSVVKTQAVGANYPPPAPGPYDIRDRLIVTFRTAAGAIMKLSVPAPLEAILANSDFVTLANPAISAFVDACIGYVQNRYGDPAAQFVSAVRTYYTRKK